MSDFYYIKPIANKNPIKGGSLQPKESYRFFDELFHHHYLERLAFSTLIKHIFKTDLQKDLPKTYLQRQTLAIKYNPEI